MSPWEKRLAQDRKEIRQEVMGMRAAALDKRMPELVARLAGECQNVIDARRKPGQVRPRNYFSDLLHGFIASNHSTWGIIAGDIDDSHGFRDTLTKAIRREKVAAGIRQRGVIFYLERA